ncbi:hypothetical protein [Sphingomonas sp.]|uniref:hypothetical protein n=1 Tax=Sphingomonas sp. TaxID=28214 RepID=UPI002CC7D050|nr:hypothetical protein [Sphingomonas sp.]HWK36137.1 hypothetical protein [Sphingomonas sp.]
MKVRLLLGPLASIALLPAAAHAEWQEASSRHFVVYSDDKPENVRAFTERLEKFDSAIRQLRMAPEDRRGKSARVTVFVLNNIPEIEKLSGQSNVAGFYIPRASGSVAFTPRSGGAGTDYGMTPQVVLFHEYAHHWMLSNWTDAAFPPWFVEGFAEFHATARFTSDGGVMFGAPPTYRGYTVSRLNLLPMSRLLRFDPGKLDPEARDALYSRGWALTHYLTFDPERRKRLADYIVAINSHKSAEEAATALGNVSGLDLTLSNYVKRSLPAITIPASQLTVGEIKLRQLTPGEAAVMPARIVSTRAVTDKTAPGVAELARRLAAPFPSDPGAQNELAEAEFDAKNYAASEAAADRVIAADPSSVHGLIYKGKAQIEQLLAAKVTDAAKWQEARGWLIKANKADTEDPYPLVEYYLSFLAAKETPPKSADGALLYAYALAPYDTDLRLLAANVYLQQGKAADARVALGPPAYSIEDGRSEFAGKVLDALDQGGTEAALAILKKDRDEAKDKKSDDGKDGKEKGKG